MEKTVKKLSSLLIAALLFTGINTGTIPVKIGKIETAHAATFSIQTGYYMGTGSDKAITGLGFQPDLVMIKADTTAGVGLVTKSSAMPANTSMYVSTTAADTSTMITLDSDGFTVSSSANVNTAGVRWNWVAFGGSDCTSSGTFCVGSYSGTGVAQNIDTGFQPDFVYTQTSGQYSIWKSSVMDANESNYYFDNSANTGSQMITTFNSSSFGVGTSANANTNGSTYYFYAFKEISGAMDVGEYTGNGNTNRAITSTTEAGLTFQGYFAIIKNRDSFSYSAALSFDRDNVTSFATDMATAQGAVKNLLATGGFTVHNNSYVNGSTQKHYYAIFGGTKTSSSGSGNFTMKTGTYSGTGVAQSITGVGFTPDLVIVKGNGTSYAVFRTSLMTDTTSTYLANAVYLLTTGITSIDNDGFTIGTDASVNTNGTTYHYQAFGNAWSPETNSGAADFAIGAYIGNGTDSRNIYDLPFTPDLLVIKRTGITGGQTAAAWSTSNIGSDLTNYFTATAASANLIQSMSSNSFQVGTATDVNTSPDLHFWFAFKNGTYFKSGNYTGTGSGHDETGLGINPDLVWVKKRTGGTARSAMFLSDTLVDGNSQYFLNTANAGSKITALISDGFTVSTGNEVNENTFTYDYAAWEAPSATPKGVTVSAISGNTTESGGTATFTVVLDAVPTGDVVITALSNDSTEGTVTSGDTLTFTTSNWSTPQTVTVTGVNDNIDDGDIGYNITMSVNNAATADSDYDAIDPADVSVTNTDNDTAGITVSTISGDTTEAGGTATFTVVLDTQPTANVSIGISSSDTTEGTVSTETLTFTTGNWSTPQTVTVTGVNDDLDDGDIAYSIVTAAASSSDGNYNGTNPSDVSVTNTDNDSAGITVSTVSGNTTEDAGTATFTVVLNTQPTNNVTIGLSSNDTTEGTISTDTLTFTTLNWSTPQTVTITGVDDITIDGNIAYSIVTAAASSVDSAYNNLNPSDVSVTNEDNDTPGITVGTISGHTTEAGGTATFTMVLDTQPTNDVTIGLSSNDTTEGTPSADTITFTSGNWSTPQTVTVTGVNDNLDDGDIVYSIVTAAASSLDSNYHNLNASDVSVTNDDNDISGITVSAISSSTNESGSTATFTVVLDTQPTANVVIDLSSNDTGENTISPTQITFTAGNWNTPQTITVTGVDDSLDDGNIETTITLAAAISDDANYNGINPSDITATNIDNDTAGITVSAALGNTTETGTTTTFTIQLDTEPTSNVTIGISSSDTTEGNASTALATFTSLNWNTPQTITITGIDDDIDDGDIAYSIITAAASSLDGNYNNLNGNDVAVTNTDNDTAGFSISSISNNTTETGATATFTVVLNTEPTADVSLDLSSSDTTEGTISTSSLTFTTENWNTPQTITVTGVNDDSDDGDIEYSIITAAASSADSTYNAINPSNVAVTNIDNDTVGITVSSISGNTTEAGGTATFTIVLNTLPTNNVSIGLSSSNTNEGTISSNTVTFTTLNWSTPQTITVTGIDESIDDGNTSYNIVIAAANSTDTDYHDLNPDDITVTNEDNDTASISVGALSGNTTEAGGTATFTLVLNTEPTDSVSIGISSSDTTEGAVSNSTITFTPLNWNTPQTITLTGQDDTIDDNNVTYLILFESSTSTDSNYNSISLDSISVINVDNDETAASNTTTTTTETGGPILISQSKSYQNQYESSLTPIETDNNIGTKVVTQGVNIKKGNVPQIIALTNKIERMVLVINEETKITLDNNKRYTGRIYTPHELTEEKLTAISQPINEKYNLLKGIDIKTGVSHINLDKPATFITQLPRNTNWEIITPERLEIWRFNELTNRWDKIEYPVHINHEKKTISFEISRFSLIAIVSKQTFKDIENHWAKPFILKLTKLGIINGTSSEKFEPDNPITRAELVKITLLALNKSILPTTKSEFKDVDITHWAYKYLQTALKNQWITLYINGEFKPESTISRIEALKIIFKTADINLQLGEKYQGLNFADLNEDSWYMDYIKTAVYLGIIENGRSNNKNFRPNDPITRAEVTKIINLVAELKN